MNDIILLSLDREDLEFHRGRLMFHRERLMFHRKFFVDELNKDLSHYVNTNKIYYPIG